MWNELRLFRLLKRPGLFIESRGWRTRSLNEDIFYHNENTLFWRIQRKINWSTFPNIDMTIVPFCLFNRKADTHAQNSWKSRSVSKIVMEKLDWPRNVKQKQAQYTFITTKTFFPDIFFLLVTVRVEKSFWGQNSHGVLFCFFPFVCMLINITRYMTIVDESPESTLQQEQEPFTEIEE